MTNTGRSIRGMTRLLTASLAVLIVVACVEELRAAPVVVRGGGTALVAAVQKKPVRRRSTRRTAARRSTPRQTTVTTTTTTTTTTAPGKVDVVIEPRNNNQDAESVESQAPPTSREDDDDSRSGDNVISGGVLNGKAISKPAPPYPAIAKAARAQGLVTVQVTVDEDGRVISAQAVSGHPLLQSAAVAAAREARFSPTLLSGQPVKVKGVVTYNFVLQ